MSYWEDRYVVVVETDWRIFSIAWQHLHFTACSSRSLSGKRSGHSRVQQAVSESPEPVRPRARLRSPADVGECEQEWVEWLSTSFEMFSNTKYNAEGWILSQERCFLLFSSPRVSGSGHNSAFSGSSRPTRGREDIGQYQRDCFGPRSRFSFPH